jgi:hypothetical protein
MTSTHKLLLQQVETWVQEVVVGLNFCPFARPVVEKNTLRTVLSEADTFDEQIHFFLEELQRLVTTSPQEIATTLLLYPNGPEDFEAFLDLVDTAEALLEEAGLEDVVQLANFHPDYLFEGEEPEDLSHWTNRTPCPILHLIRVEDVSRAVDSNMDTESIPEHNIRTLHRLTSEERSQFFPWLTRKVEK